MKTRTLNRIIADISDPAVREYFIGNCDPAIRSRIIPYAAGIYPFENSLYISDSPENCALFIKMGYPTAAYIHDNSRGLDFSEVKYHLEDPELIEEDDYENIFRRLAGIPLDILETKRLFVRETALPDIEAFYELYEDPEVASFMEPLYPPDEERAYQESYIRNVYGFCDIGIWTVIYKETDEIIGRMGIEYCDEAGCVELGFMVAKEHRRKGLAMEACLAIIDYAHNMEGINRVRARVRKDNTASQNLCTRLGMKPVKELNDDLVEWSVDI